ncbi:MAG: lysophospholipid acyltransferase family protein [Syntrophorhabdus aromaticivorans]|uniref:Lysophospholipid acyltransferase family protein n=1 Tax=Syntrophorhabdus aromaticivorans TaxID=328301 RepID=A0A971M2D4_9BACT|nr:lysophospholipid acyltransferase family protein [Syntrophorhabdus aromaticivorans]
MSKRIKSFLMLHVLPPLVYGFLMALRITARIRYVNREAVVNGWNNDENFIFCFWHGRLLMMPFANFRGKGKVLISRHRDGELIARVMGYFRLGSIRGSYRKGTVSSLREIMADLKSGFDVAITPDGPKGPRYQVKDGIVELARLTGKAIIPLTYSASKKKHFSHGIDLSSPILFHGC